MKKIFAYNDILIIYIYYIERKDSLGYIFDIWYRCRRVNTAASMIRVK